MRNEPYLAPRAANYQALTPQSFLDRALAVHPEKTAVLWRDQQWSYAEFGGVVSRMAVFLQAQGIGQGDVVSVMASNRPETLAAHYAVPMLGAVLNTINTRLDVASVSYILDHANSCLLISDPDCNAIALDAAKTAGVALHVMGQGASDFLIRDATPLGNLFGGINDEWQPLCLNYTSGTSGKPKGVVYHHRGAYLNALGNVMALGLTERSVYLWTLPMFHCNGWCHTWASRRRVACMSASTGLTRPRFLPRWNSTLSHIWPVRLWFCTCCSTIRPGTIVTLHAVSLWHPEARLLRWLSSLGWNRWAWIFCIFMG